MAKEGPPAPKEIRRSRVVDFGTVLKTNHSRRNKSAARLGALVREASAFEEATLLVKRVLPRSCAAHCLGAGVRGDKLYIAVDASAWASKIRLDQKRIVQALKPLAMFAMVESIQTQVKPPRRSDTDDAEFDMEGFTNQEAFGPEGPAE